MFSSTLTACANIFFGSRPATTGSILVDRKKKSTSVHFFTGLIDRAYAAGKASRRTRTVDRTLAVSEFSSGGQGPELKKVLYPSTDSGANSAGGFFAASGSEWKDVSTIHRTGRTKRIPTTHAVPLRMIALRGFLRCWMRWACCVPGVVALAMALIGSPPGTAWTRSGARTSR